MRYCKLAPLLLTFSLLQAEPEITSAPPSLQEIYCKIALEPSKTTFTPPAGWKFVDPASLSKYVRMMFVGQGASDFPPSMILGYDDFSGPAAKFLAFIKKKNQEKGFETKDLGKVKTPAGIVQLLQVDSVSKWGKERQMQAILSFDDRIWILTCSALKEEFSKFYKEFFDALKTLSVNPVAEVNNEPSAQ